MHASSSTKAIALPFRLELTPAARQKEKLYVTAGVLFVGTIAGILAGALVYVLFKNTMGGAVAGIVAALLVGGYALDWFQRKLKGDIPRGSVEIGAARIKCRDLVDGDLAWSDLTAFRWVLRHDQENTTQVERSDGLDSASALAAKEFVLEAADTKDTSEDSESGYYSRPGIQFDLDDLCVAPPSRADASAVVAMLNRLQAAAAAGTLHDGDTVEVPAFLNAVPAAGPAVTPAQPKGTDSSIRVSP